MPADQETKKKARERFPLGVKEKAQKSARIVFGWMLWQYLQRSFNIELKGDSEKHLEQMKEFLKEGSVVLYINHTEGGLDDVMLGISVMMGKLGGSLNHLGAPVGIHHVDPEYATKNSKGNIKIMRMMKKYFGIEIWPVATDSTRSKVPQDSRNKLRNQYINESELMLTLPYSLLGIAAEGTRTKGALSRAKKGIGKTAQYANEENLPVRFVAMALDSEKGETSVQIGKPTDINELYDGNVPEDAQEIADRLMHELAKLLREEQRGIYSS